ncbi:4-diphosphocytidyl-2-C-methyl-D-erythritol kinase [Treponema sp. R8-4-B8]
MPIFPEKLPVFAPAKVNLHLAVKNRRPDGFHDIDSVFLAVNFGDTLYFEAIEGKNTVEIDMKGLNSPLPPEKNIIFKAISLFREKTGFSQGVKITVEKRIPMGGGLGGGSSDASATLLALNKLAGLPCRREDLLEIAACLGSDVPFFVYETPAARVTGRGERILPINAPMLFLVLVNPGFSSETSAAYKLLDENRIYKPSSNDDISEFLKEGIFEKKAFSHFTNDFLSVFPEPEKSVYNEIIVVLKKLGAHYANLSGSGATCFGVFADRELARKAADALRGKWAFVRDCCTYIKEK